MESGMCSGRSIFITGGTGFLGKTLIDFLLKCHKSTGEPIEITVLSRDPETFLNKNPTYVSPGLRFIKGSLNQFPEPDRQYTDIIHAAADTHWQGSSAAEWVSQIVNGTRTVLDFALKSGAKRFLHTSSGAIYGPQPEDLEELSEDYLGAPPTSAPYGIYGQAKRVAEQLCNIYFREYGLETVNARCFTFASKHQPLDGPYALGNFIRDALYADHIKVRGDGSAIRSYLDGEEMAQWLVTLLMRGIPGEAYNLGSNQGISILELAATVAKLLSPKKEILIENRSTDNKGRSRYIPSIDKIAKLGLYPRHALEEAITRSFPK